MGRKKKVCVVGGGWCGLIAARQLLKFPAEFEVDIFEKGDEIGGTWVYTDMVGTDKRGEPVHPSIYKVMPLVFYFFSFFYPSFLPDQTAVAANWLPS